ncbi:MAG TPA: hypothetical protein PKY30_15220, partial [Myxococcota bacterium]|nr:hypothetical protein [Myxococcota bacterium]
MEGLSTASVYISGPGGRAVAVADQGIWTMTMDTPTPQPADRRHLHLLGQADPHLEVMDDVWPFEQARRRLRRAWATDRLCRLTLVLLDPGHSLRLRRQLAPVLEDLLVEVGPEPLSALLLSAAPPAELDLAGGTDLAGPQLSALLTELSPRLSTLREAVATWADLVSTLPTLERAEVHHLIQTEALPRIGRGEERSVLLRWAMQQLARKPQSLSVVHTWLSRVVPQAARVQPKTEKKKSSSSKRDVVQHTIHGRKTQVESQLVQITAALEAADIVAADRLLGFLREYQTDQGSRDFLAKSLCTLAQRAEA